MTLLLATFILLVMPPLLKTILSFITLLLCPHLLLQSPHLLCLPLFQLVMMPLFRHPSSSPPAILKAPPPDSVDPPFVVHLSPMSATYHPSPPVVCSYSTSSASPNTLDADFVLTLISHVLFPMSHRVVRDIIYEIMPLLDLLTSMVFHVLIHLSRSL